MAQKKHPIEYRLLVRHFIDDTLKKEGFQFLLETTKQFTNFNYVIDVKENVVEKKILWTLHGLRAPSMNMPSTGTAKFQKVYFELPKSAHFTLIKKAKVRAETEFTFSKKAITSTKKISSFLKIYTDEQEFESKRVGDVVLAEPKLDIHREPIVKKTIKKKS